MKGMNKQLKLKKAYISLIIFILLFNIPVFSKCSSEPDITAGSAILVDNTYGKVLYAKNENEKMYPASTTKILTAILAIENCDNLDDIVTVPYEAIATITPGYSIAALQAGEQISVRNLLSVLLVHSANDAANVLAYYVSGSVDNFVTLMNNKVAELGLKNTHFTNPSGMHDENHYTTASDLAQIMRYCIKNPTFKSICKQQHCTIPATNKYEQRFFVSTNDLIIPTSTYYYKYAICGKTGYTTQAKNTLVTFAEKDGFELISVVLSVGVYPNNISGKFTETKSLFEYGYNNYEKIKIREKNAIAEQIEIKNGTKDTKNLDLLISDDIYAIAKSDESTENIEPEIQIDENLMAPIAKNKKVGTITYEIDGIKYSADLIASHSVKKSSFTKLLIQIIFIIIILFLLYKILFGQNNNRKKSPYRKHKNSSKLRK